jgi:hypothetical protein
MGVKRWRSRALGIWVLRDGEEELREYGCKEMEKKSFGNMGVKRWRRRSSGIWV